MELLMIQSSLSSLFGSSIILSTQFKHCQYCVNSTQVALCISDNKCKFLARKTSEVVMI